MNDETKKEDLENNHRPYQKVISYTCSMTIPDDETTKITIESKSVGLLFAASPEDAFHQIDLEQRYSKNALTTYLMGYVSKHLSSIDPKTISLAYEGEPVIREMTDEEVETFDEEILDANVYQ